MNNLNGNRKNEFRRKQEEKQRKLTLKIEDEAGELREGSLKSEEAIPSLDELCAMGERVEQQTTFSAKEAIRNKIKARRDAERYKTTSTDSEKWTPNPFEDSNAAAIESPKNEDTLNTTRKHADAQSTKSAGLKTSKRRSIVEMVQKLKKYVPIVVCGDVLYYYNGYYYEAIGLEKLIKLYRKYVDYDLNNEPSLYAYKDLYQCCTTDPELERSEPENQSIHAPLENGVYDLMKKELKPHDPRRLIFTYIKASYDESAECPVFNSFLKQITHGNPQLEERFWMAIGYLMIYPARGKFFMETHYDDTLLGSLQKELDSFNTSKAIEWLAYDVDYLMGEAYPGETAYVLITEDEYTFSKQGAYKLTYVDTGKTTELVDDQGFRWEASVYFVVDEDTYNENLQKMFRAEQALYDTYERILNNFGLAE